MSSIQQKLNHTAMLAKWKLDQQIRLNNSQTLEKQIQGQLGSLKIELANGTYNLYKEDKISDETLKQICEKLVNAEKNLQNQIQQTKLIKNEQPPSFEMVSEGQKHQISGETSSVGLICPKCNKPIPVKYCPDCGQEGMPAG